MKPDCRVVGEHQGLSFYTLGQRQGLGIGGVKNADDAPWFVASKNFESNTLIVAQGTDHPLLYTTKLTATDIHWINATPPDPQQPLLAKTRYRQPDQLCTLTLQGDELHVSFDKPQRAVTPGQAVVFYQGHRCLGGATIKSTTT